MSSSSDENRFEENPQEFIYELNKRLSHYSEKYSQQFSLKIPKGVVKTINSYRDTFFPYLKDSEYKSNLCYLLQLIDYQIWNYQLFRPGLSLENTYFYQLMITMGVVLEGVTAAILLNPFVEPHPKDRSLGSVPKKFLPAMQVIIENTFKTNIDWMIHWKLLPNSLTYKLTQMRVSVRNQVHIQGWVGRIYGSIDFDTFKRTLKQFKELLIQIRDSIQPLPDPKQMWNFIFPDADPNAFFEGKIVHYNYEKGFGFIAAEKFQKNIYFHRQALSPNWKSVPDILGKKAYFQLGRNQKGRIAINIRIEGEPAS